MKHLKHYKIFEAFESTILTKTLAHIKDKSDRDNFFNMLKRLTSSIDYPFSQLKDQYFEYLPFKKALLKADMTGDEPCIATSKSEFPQYAVEGSKCDKGKLKRKWGSRTRDVVCPVCNGSGVAPKTSEMKLLKFWFDKDGKFIATTAVDGINRKVVNPSKGSFSDNMSDYTVVKDLTYDEVQQLNTGNVISCLINGARTLCFIYKVPGGSVYAIQDRHSGTSPSGSVWRNYGTYSWQLGRGEFRDAQLLQPKAVKEEEKVEVNPYEWNVGISTRWSSMRIDTSIDVQTQIAEAHFAIILDFGKLKKSEFKSKREIEEERAKSKEGSVLDPSQDDDEIKKKNIERYMNQLAQKMDISSDITNCNRLVTRALGYKNALFMILSTDVISNLNSLVTRYLDLMRSEDEEDKETNVNRVKASAEDLIKRGINRGKQINDSLDELKKDLKSTNNEELLKFVGEVEQFSAVVYEKLTSYQIDSLEDIEVLIQKANSIKQIVKSDRYQTNRLTSYFIDNLVRGYGHRTASYLKDRYYVDIEGCRRDMEIIKKIIEKI